MGAGASTALVVGASPAAAGRRRQLVVQPRSAWAGPDRPPGPIAPEPSVRFLLVHHTVNANDYAAASVPALLAQIHAFHTGPDKGWPDIAYNFVVDRFGGVWETRAGSLDGAVAGDATGGSQGFDQKCAFLGDHRTEPPSQQAQDAMAGLLAWLADRHGLDTTPGATTTFTSRGSNRWPAGTEVATATITGHRTMSQTACPGDAGMVVVTDVLPAATTARRPVAATPTTTTTTTVTTGVDGTPDPTVAPPSPSTIAPITAPTTIELSAVPEPTEGGEVPLPLGIAAAGAAATVVGALVLRLRSR